ncbi:hypothetical protein COY30_00840 [Candidatus Woesebacteria bacterium CG_4_10_14_0_2_um_filter_44_9]|uniref:Adenylate kinase n=1 Tax=Candidatus Woesebacteria bacterium CG_4_10_14_0_2_um_filter_44_9 TaxID=1975055 RepID=A0A2M7TI40_9BACT|nr:MAG: hypothetical protein COY30_00840 [Candidatus Woesebacteria bacterium CG_4_10_14_0_2_um_filter_44_9]
MKGLEFPIIGTKIKNLTKKFDLTSPQTRKAYFEVKCGDEIDHIREFLKTGNFMAFLLGKKNSGKGTYSHLFTEIFGEGRVTLVSVGDVVRETHANWKTFQKSQDYLKLKQLYRGYISFDEAVKALLGRSTGKLLPTEFILALLKFKLAKLGGKSVFIDGLPREIDQVSYSLYFRDLAGFTDARDLFILIDIPESVIDERIKYRVVCPICHDLRNRKLLIPQKINYDVKQKEFNLICDNPACKGAVMEEKEGDDLGIEPLRPRLAKDEEILKKAFALHGIPKILLRNHVSVTEAKKYFDDYEITPEYVLSWDKKARKVKVNQKPWTVSDDNGVESYSLLAAPVMVSLLKQMADVLK